MVPPREVSFAIRYGFRQERQYDRRCLSVVDMLVLAAVKGQSDGFRGFKNKE